MNTRKHENRIMAKYTEVANIIRKHGSIKFGLLSVEAHLAPSTLHEYWRAMRDIFEDLEYSGGVFYAHPERHHRMPDGKLVPLEK